MKEVNFDKIEIVTDQIENEKYKRKFLNVPSESKPLKYPSIIDKHLPFLEKRVKNVFNKFEGKLNIQEIEFLFILIKTLNKKIYTDSRRLLKDIAKDEEIRFIPKTDATKLSKKQSKNGKNKDRLNNLNIYFKKFCKLKIENPEEQIRKKRFYSTSSFIIKNITSKKFRRGVVNPHGEYFVNQKEINGYFGVGIIEFYHILKGRLYEKDIKEIVINYPIDENKLLNFDRAVKKMEAIFNEINGVNTEDDEIILNKKSKIKSHKLIETKMKELSKYLNNQREEYHRYRKIYDDCFISPEGWNVKIKYTQDMEN